MELVARFWWTNLIRGLLAFLFGVFLLIMPALFSIFLLVICVSVYFLLDGIFALIFFFKHPKTAHRWWIFAEGVMSILAAVIVFFWPVMSAILLLYFIAFWAIFTGIFEIIYTISQWKTLPGKGWLLVGGIISIIFGFALVISPAAGALALLWVIALYLILFGMALVVFSIWQFAKGKGIIPKATS